jgi:hypothetical protein
MGGEREREETGRTYMHKHSMYVSTLQGPGIIWRERESPPIGWGWGEVPLEKIKCAML